jgi:hypothetical protein
VARPKERAGSADGYIGAKDHPDPTSWNGASRFDRRARRVGGEMDVSRTEPPQYVAEHIRDALRNDPRVGELDVQVRITGRRVFVNGNVATAERQRAITEIVEELLPDVEVLNETSIQSVPETEDQERLA